MKSQSLKTLMLIEICLYFQHYINLLINCGMDFTMEFSWITNKTHYQPTYINLTTAIEQKNITEF